jgi:hypothetical protein
MQDYHLNHIRGIYLHVALCSALSLILEGCIEAVRERAGDEFNIICMLVFTYKK